MADQPRISIILAAANNGTIGRDGDMPWQLSTDLKRFKAITMGCPVIMGRKTFQSVGRPLPGRLNIVISRQGFKADGTVGASSLEEAIAIATNSDPDLTEIFIIGGGQIYQNALPLADRIYMTHVEAEIDGDTHFTAIDSKIWATFHEEHIPAGQKDTYPTRYVIYDRIHA